MAVGVNIVSTFDSKGIARAIKDFQKLEGAGNKATFGLRTLDKGMTNSIKKVAKFGAIAGAAFGAIGFALVKSAEKMETSNARILQINKSMGLFGSATQQVTDRIIKMAESQAMATGIDRNAIKETAAKLLTFKELAATANVLGGAFDRAQQSALDLAAAGFGDATQNATQLGKALNDPIKGITALARSGVTFTEQEKAKIKTLVESGKMLEAQDTLLKAIETQVGGTAVATANASDKMRQSLGMAGEALGVVLLPLFVKLSDFIIQKVTPYIQNLADVLGESGIRGAIKILAGDFLKVTANMGAFGNMILVLTAAFVALRLVAIAATISQNLFKVALLTNPIGIFVAAMIALGVAVVAAYIKFEGFRKVVNYVINSMISLVQDFVNKFIQGINVVIIGVNGLIRVANFFGKDIETIGHIGEVEFGRIGAAAAGARKQIGGVAEVAGAMAAKEGGVQKVIDALKKVAKEAGDDNGGAAKAVETAKEKLQKFIDALKGLTSAQRSAREADKGLLKSRTDLLEATAKLADAQAYFNQIVSGYGVDSGQAKDRQLQLAKAQRAVERSGYDVEGSVFAVTKAEKDLADLRLDPESSATAIREAEISLAEAKLSVKDATESQVEATNDLQEAESLLNETINGAKEGSDAFTEALGRLNDAKKAQEDATEAVTSAIEQQTDAVDKLREAEEKLSETRSKTPAAIIARAGSIIAGGTSRPSDTGSGVVGSSLFAGSSAIRDAMLRDLTPFATGGIVTSPTAALIGEAGAEAIIPLDRLNSGMTVNVVINAGMGTDPAKLGDEIVDVLTRYQRRNGALPLRVA